MINARGFIHNLLVVLSVDAETKDKSNMILMIDNYDSFTYNLVQYLGELGAEVETVRNDAVTVDEIEKMKPEGIVISPGPCTPNEAGICLDVVRNLGSRFPILGCAWATSASARLSAPGWSGPSGSCTARPR